MTSYEKIPAIKSEGYFPIADIVDSKKQQVVDEWFSTISLIGKESFAVRIRAGFETAALPGTSRPYATHLAATALCREWDLPYGSHKSLATRGYMVSKVFNKETHYLPACTADLSPDLRAMKNEQPDHAQLFGRTAWNSMQAYPNIRNNFDRLLELCQERYPVYSDEERDQIRAGLVLPYMFAWTSGLIDNTPHFTRLKTQTGPKLNLQTSEFRDFFTSGEPDPAI